MTRGTGGVVLLRRPEEITVWDVYAALEPDEPQELLGIHPAPLGSLPVGSRDPVGAAGTVWGDF